MYVQDATPGIYCGIRLHTGVLFVPPRHTLGVCAPVPAVSLCFSPMISTPAYDQHHHHHHQKQPHLERFDIIAFYIFNFSYLSVVWAIFCNTRKCDHRLITELVTVVFFSVWAKVVWPNFSPKTARAPRARPASQPASQVAIFVVCNKFSISKIGHSIRFCRVLCGSCASIRRTTKIERPLFRIL